MDIVSAAVLLAIIIQMLMDGVAAYIGALGAG
jgi:hypothetical protein